ncbi:hypothetical protein GCM10010168_77220 [Actinoplanes ianthinogenes]|uniref:Uncharacterized protein n=1 Tax=Actinoplanes ianthinogenes TaxID=122358 RepID=A0ABM7M9S2_9ACTN|nr:hypothetical protein [Actinoplanes ianthinogenes]BCJ48352.1 hypothetical protein Aiant_90090 [Actinoplanes ianthinogenes]GGR46959.1 hypothetical protein GCM10010168_77220 [Actinoplanes ianthinogenes]
MRRALIGTGLLLFSYALSGLLTDADVNLPGVVIFGLAVLVLHDAVLLPLILAGGALLRRVVPPLWWTAVQFGAIAGLTLLVITVPLLLGPGLLAYGKSLILILGVVAVTVLGRKGFESIASRRSG